MHTSHLDDQLHHGVTQRVGLLLPSSNVLTEREFARLMPDNMVSHAARLKIASATAAQLDAMVSEAERAADTLRDTGANLLVFACTSGSFLHGRAYDAALGKGIQDATGIPTLTTSRAVDLALNALDVTDLTVVAPYDDEITARAERFLTECGYRVRAIRGLGETTGLGLASFTPRHIAQTAETVIAPQTAAVLLLCTNFRGTEAIAYLEQRLNVPVVSSNQATLWAAAQALGSTMRPGAPGELTSRSATSFPVTPVG